MVLPSPETVWHSNRKELQAMLDSNALVSKPRTVQFYAPSFTYYKTKAYQSSPNSFPTVSVTSSGCELNCKHCGGKVLKTMQAANTPEKLLAVATEMKQDGASGFLVSGGCRLDGSVPLKPFIPAMEKIKRELGLTVFVHTGLIDPQTARALKEAGVDAALIDIIGSDETIKQIYSLNMTTQDYGNSLGALKEAGLNLVPHIVVGLHFGKLKGEFQALKIAAAVNPSALVIIAFMPISGTAMAEVKPPQPMDIAKVVAAARLVFPQTPLALGCVRPKGKHRALTDVLALKAGADAIVFPSEEAIVYAQKQGYATSFSSYCCARIYTDATFRSRSK
jgi:lipoyl synthase